MLFTHLQLNKDYFKEPLVPSRSVNTQQSFTTMGMTLSQACVEAFSPLFVDFSSPHTLATFYLTLGREILVVSSLNKLQMLITTSTSQ